MSETADRERRHHARRDNVMTRRYIKTLRRRADFLAKRIRNYDPDLPGEDPSSRDRAELGALEWALKTIATWVAEDPATRKETDDGQ